MYRDGLGVPANHKFAASHFARAAESNFPNAMAHLAELTYRGLGVPQDPRRARELAQEAADLQDPLGMIYFGLAYYQGWGGVAVDYQRAKSLWSQVAGGPYAIADTFLGQFYFDGYAGPPDYEKAVKHFRSASERSEPLAKYYLGSAYGLGRGVRKSYEAAKGYFEESFELGLGMAGMELATMYAYGLGVTPDIVTAYAWVDAADRKGGSQSPAHAEIKRKIIAATSQQQRQMAAELVREIMARKPSS
jgi:TPR repeat protein